MLNRIWLGFFFVGIFAAAVPVLSGDWSRLEALQQALFDMARLSAEIALGLVGLMCLWLGLFRIAEKSGLIAILARGFSPLFRRLMPEVPANHPAMGSVSMNLMANMLGLDNAATPLGLKAMADLQAINPTPDTASNAQIMFLVLNASSVTLIPVTVFLYRAQLGAVAPSDVLLPILLATACSTLAGVAGVMIVQRISWRDPVLLLWLLAITATGSLFVTFLLGLSADGLSLFSRHLASSLLVGVVLLFLASAALTRQDAYQSFIEGAKEGFFTAINIIPYLVAMLVAIGVLRQGGALDYLLGAIRWLVTGLNFDSRWVDALPVGIMKPLSGSGARAMMIETMQHYGVDSFQGRLAAIMQGSTETTFYVLTLYFGSVGILKIRYALWCGLLADAAGLSAAIAICYWFYG